MMKKVFGIIYIVLALAVCLSAVVTMPFIAQDGAKEKRILAEFPSVTDEEGKIDLLNFPSGFEDWLNDHVGLRTIWMQQYADMHARFGASVNDQVIIGKDGWLFYAPTLPDYSGVGALSENELWRVKCVLETIDRQTEAKLMAFFAPNKNTVYPEYMPDIYPKTDKSHALTWLSENAGVPVIAGIDAFQEAGLYYRTDTHWNEKGARIGAGLIIDGINTLMNTNAVKPDPDEAYSLSDYTGDLGQMLFPYSPPADHSLVYGSDNNFKYAGRYRTPDDMTITTSGSGEDVKVLVLRDSFSNLLIPHLSNAFASVQYRRAMPLPFRDADEYNVVVLEMVERRIREIIQDTPNMLSKETEVFPESNINTKAGVFAAKEKDRVKVFGKTDDGIDRIVKIKICISEGGQMKTYEAFPAAGSEEMSGDNCFSMYIETVSDGALAQVYMEGADGYLLSEMTPIVFETQQ